MCLCVPPSPFHRSMMGLILEGEREARRDSVRDGRGGGRGVKKGDDGVWVCVDVWKCGGCVVDEPDSFGQLFVWELPRPPPGQQFAHSIHRRTFN